MQHLLHFFLKENFFAFLVLPLTAHCTMTFVESSIRKWNGYHLNDLMDEDHLKGMLQNMIIPKDFTDVTLVSNDSKAIKAHRKILSATIPALKKILQIENHNHPVIYLTSVKYEEMEAILKFIYTGETVCNEYRIDELLKNETHLEMKEVNESLQRKEAISETMREEDTEDMLNKAMENKENNKQIEEDWRNLQIKIENSKEISKEEAHQKKNPSDLVGKNDDFTRNISAENNLGQDWLTNSKVDLEENCIVNQVVSNNQKDPVIKMATVNMPPPGPSVQPQTERWERFKCDPCNKVYAHRMGLWKHNKNVHENAKYPCRQCDFQAVNQIHLTRHIHSSHGGFQFICNLCQFPAATESNLKKHIKNKHI